MPASCYHCGKTSMYGRSHTHRRGVAGGRWKKRAQKTPRIFKANLQRATVLDGEARMQIRLCGKCIKRIKFDVERGTKPFLQLLQLTPLEAKETSEEPQAVATA